MYVEGLKFALQYVTNRKNRKKVEDEIKRLQDMMWNK